MSKSARDVTRIIHCPFPKGTIEDVQVVMASEEEILNRSSLVVATTENLSSSYLSSNGNTTCDTCKLGAYCPGHMGVISTGSISSRGSPVVRPLCMNVALWVLRSVCSTCGSLIAPIAVIEETVQTKSLYSRLKQISELTKDKYFKNGEDVKACKPSPSSKTHCPSNKKYIKSSKVAGHKLQICVEVDKAVSLVDPIMILEIFQKVAGVFPKVNATRAQVALRLQALGFRGTQTPLNFMFAQYIPVCPLTNRPTEPVDGQFREDYLTGVYTRLINTLSKANHASQISGVIRELYTDDKKKTGRSLGTGDPIDKRLTKKEGFPRQNGMGKRCNGTARAVLVPIGTSVADRNKDIRVSFGDIFLPEASRVLSVTETVTLYNKSKITSLYLKGHINRIHDSSGRVYDGLGRKNHIFKVGEVVDRQLQEGDTTLFVRQPTLHSHSLTAYRVRFWDKLVMGLPSWNTNPHNADFDGDEGNIHNPVDHLSRAEMRYMVGCWNIIIGKQSTKPAYGLVYNCPLASYLMSSYRRVFTDSEVDFVKSLMEDNEYFKTLKKRLLKERGSDVLDGPGLLSIIFPPYFYYSAKGVVIKNGVLVKGVLKGAHIAGKQGGIIHYLHHHFGRVVTARFLTEGQNILDWFIHRTGFSAGYSDCSLDNNELNTRIQEHLDLIEKDVEKIRKTTPEYPTEIEKEVEEISIRVTVGNIATYRDNILDGLVADDNPMRVMAESGAKGSVRNLSEIMSMIGQQFVDNKRPDMELSVDPETMKGTRFLPYSDPGSTKLTDRGFVVNSFNEGMSPKELVPHMMSSRVGLISSATRTSLTGHLQRTMAKSFEDFKMSYQGSVVSSNGSICLLNYYDGYDSAKLLPVTAAPTGEIFSPFDIGYLSAMVS